MFKTVTLFLLAGAGLVSTQSDDLATAFGDLNQARQLQGLQALTWSPDLTAYAQLWANQMGSGQVPFEHASGPYRPQQGENLYVQQSGFCDAAYDNPFRSAMHAWLAQAPLYDGKPIAGHEPWLHWSQCMWSSTEQVGCARAYSISESGKIFVVCRFYPEGNIVGQKPF